MTSRTLWDIKSILLGLSSLILEEPTELGGDSHMGEPLFFLGRTVPLFLF